MTDTKIDYVRKDIDKLIEYNSIRTIRDAMLSSAWEFQKWISENGLRFGQGLVNKFGKEGQSYSYLYNCEDDELIINHLTEAFYNEIES